MDGGVSETRPPTSATILIILISLLYYIEVGACLRTLRILSPDHHWQANRNKMATMKRRGAKDYITHSITTSLVTKLVYTNNNHNNNKEQEKYVSLHIHFSG